MNKATPLVALVMAMYPVAILAQDFDAGVTAYNSGNYEKAMQEWRPLAEQGDAEASVRLGKMFLNGAGIPKDYEEAFRMFSQAASEGNIAGQFWLSSMYRQGQGVNIDTAKSIELLTLAAMQGSTISQYVLGTTYSRGEIVDRDLVQSEKWLRMAARGICQIHFLFEIKFTA